MPLKFIVDVVIDYLLRISLKSKFFRLSHSRFKKMFLEDPSKVSRDVTMVDVLFEGLFCHRNRQKVVFWAILYYDFDSRQVLCIKFSYK